VIRATPTTADVRSAVLAAAWAFVGFGLYVTAIDASGWISFPLLPVLAIFAMLAFVNVVLARFADVWAGPAWTAWAYEGFHAAALTVVVYFFGGMSLGVFVVVYSFLVVHTEVLRPDASVYVTANLCAVCYAALATLEHLGWVESRYGLQVPLTAGNRLAVVSFAAISFNFLALYASRHGTQLRRMAARLEQMVTDRTADLERTNRELTATAAALETKQAEVQSFVYTVTHDVKNPLNAIVMLTDLVLEEDGANLGAEARSRLERVLRTAEHTEDMIRDLLGLFRVTSRAEPATWVDLDMLAHATLETLRPQLDAKGVRVELAPLPQVWGEPSKLGHLLANLLGNAVKYVPATNGRVTVSGELDDGQVVLTVRDNGIGIDPVYHRRIFEPFGRVPGPQQLVDGREVAGSGVGLAIVQQIARAHGGAVEVESATGAGSTFHVRLPQGPRP
jgi:signal transduction histidine kinase